MDAVLFPEVALLLLFLIGVDAESCEYDIIGGWRNGEKEWKECPGGCCITDCCPRSEAEDVTNAVIGAAVVVAIVVGVVVAVVCCRRRRARTQGQILNAARQRVTIIGITTTVPYTTMENAEEPQAMAPPCYEDVAGLPPYTEVAAGTEQQQQQQQFPPTMGAK